MSNMEFNSRVPPWRLIIIVSCITFTFLVVSGFWLFKQQTEKAVPPNIVFILVDTLRADHLPSYGYQRDTALKLNQLARKGVLFERVVSPSSWTKTSMASIMTGLNPLRHGVQGVKDVLPNDLTTIAEGFSGNGYLTIGINTNPWLMSKFGFHQGFDIYSTISARWPYAEAIEVNIKALAYLRKFRSERPFFLYLHYMDVHGPSQPKPPYYKPGPPLMIPEMGLLTDDEVDIMYRKKGLNAPGVQQRVIDLYDGEIRTLDSAIGKLLKELKDIGSFDNTIFVITSDHGEAFREHGATEHGKNLYPEVIEVPLILYSPKYLPAGNKIGSQVCSIDIAPTLFTLAEITVPESFEGKLLLWDGHKPSPDCVAISAVGLNDHIPDLNYVSVTSSEYLYIREKVNNKVEFYDLRTDPGAQKNLGLSHPTAAIFARIERGGVIKLTQPEQQELDQSTVNQLKSLGYLQ